ncbi:hypothetical protein N7509_002015 [Penicillium cosmopolitanum]|uniref:D-isomer specific 2-hydroxyacid dehydrogenase NAD-binding domain-containing protein n=1 Tax=Penicillium cosmopolitanum TaxID=1131564 RepID=A0A9X0BCX1_9EURO|nr:uncharacterized protein N7509_002015 [Penicillium cosmopolitanum]KAJ5408132.1 hypothetical protein N7509_002015 [Penicillium cosmopolitanum]
MNDQGGPESFYIRPFALSISIVDDSSFVTPRVAISYIDIFNYYIHYSLEDKALGETRTIYEREMSANERHPASAIVCRNSALRILKTLLAPYSVNISRGQVIDQDALITALKTPVQEGGLRAAALDVTDPEPLPKGHELWSLPNVTLTLHRSGVSSRSRERFLQVLEANLERWDEGRELLNVVSKNKGY